MSLKDDENDDTGPAFYIPTIDPPTRYPRHITGPLRTLYDHLHRLYYQLNDLWNFQLKNHRDSWSIQAAHDFWRRHGPPRTLDGGRKFGWNPEGNWILDAIADTEHELADLEQDARKRMKAINAVLRNQTRASGKSRLGAAGVSFDEPRDMGFTSDARYQNAAGGLNLYTPGIDTPCFQPSNLTWCHDDDDDNYIRDMDSDTYDDDGGAKLPGFPEKPIIIDDDDDNDDSYQHKDKGKEAEENLRYFRTYFQSSACHSPVTNNDDKNNEQDLFLPSLQDSPSLMGLNRRRRNRRLENSPEYIPEYIPGNVMRDIYGGDETAAAGGTTFISSRSSSPETVQGEHPTSSSDSSSSSSSSSSKKRDRSEEEEEVEVEYLGEARCKKSPKRGADSKKEEVLIASVSI